MFSHGGRLLGHHIGATIGLDPLLHKSYLNVYFDLKKRKPVELKTEDEWKLYRSLFFKSLTPGYLLFETTYYPLTNLATYLKRHKEDNYYNRFKLGYKEINLLEILTAEFEEPIAFTLFSGEIAPFFEGSKSQEPEKDERQVGYSLMGFLLSYGFLRVKEMELVDNNWYQLQWKVKGQKKSGGKKITWNFQAGFILHEKETFYDAVTVSLLRDKSDKSITRFSMIENTRYELTLHIPAYSMERYRSFEDYLVLAKLSIGKSFPVRLIKKFLLKVSTGAKWHRFFDPEQGTDDAEWAFFFVPSISF